MSASIALAQFSDSLPWLWNVLVNCAFQSACLIVGAALAWRLLRRRSAAVRHLLWASTLALLLTLPVFATVLPGWSLLPAWPTQSGTDRTFIGIVANGSDEQNQPAVEEAPAPVRRNARSGESTQIAEGASVQQFMEKNLSGDDVQTWSESQLNSRVVPRTTDQRGPSSAASTVLFVWIVGCLLGVLRLVFGTVYLSSIAKRLDWKINGPLHRQFESLQHELGMAFPIRLLVAGPGTMPMAWGVLRPSVMIPDESRHWTDLQIRAVLLHELAHVRRRDAVWQYVVEAAKAVYWFHPFVWFAAWRTQVEREQACDDVVLNSGITCSDYARQLLDLVAGGRLTRLGMAAGVAMASTGKLERRLESIMDETIDRRPAPRSATVFIAVATMFSVLAVSMIRTSAAVDDGPPGGAKRQAKVEGKRNRAVPVSQAEVERQRRIRELIYVLRDHRPMARTDEWAAAIRELIEIGKPAVPELVAELDRTERNATLRGLAFSLRGIGDPRAVDGLIRALAKTKLPGRWSDYYLYVSDQRLMAFMRQHQDFPDDPNKNFFSYGRPINELRTALARITRHEEPINTEDADPGRHWSVWWEKHAPEYLSAAERKSVELARRGSDWVEEAGLARFGPLFPTGKDVVLGPVHEVKLEFDGYMNGRSYIDFDTGRVYARREGKAARSHDTAADYVGWLHGNGIDARFDTTVWGSDLHAWLIDNRRWETLESEIHSGGTLRTGREASSELVPSGPGGDDSPGDDRATYLFTTREGGRGVVQVFPRDKDGSACRIRYRMWGDKGNQAPPTRLPEEQRREANWEPERLVVLKSPGRGRAFLFNLETGKKVIPPDDLIPDDVPGSRSLVNNKKLAAWCRAQGVFVGSEEGYNFDQMRRPHTVQLNLIGLDMKTLLVKPSSFEKMTLSEVNELRERWPERDERSWMVIPSQAFPPETDFDLKRDTYLILTRSGIVGLLEIESVSEDLSSIAFRYRLLKRNPAKD